MKRIDTLPKGAYMKRLLVLVVALNVLFALGVLIAMKFGADEPATLIDRWFGWTTAEIFASAGIKISKLVKEAVWILKQKTDSGGEG